MGTVVKKSHSFAPDLYRELAAAARAAGVSESAALAEGAALYVARQAGLRAVREWEAENGAFTSAEIAEAERTLDEHGISK